MTQSLGDVVGLEWSVNYRLQPVIDDCCEATGVDSLEAVGQTLPSIDSEADEKEPCYRTPGARNSVASASTGWYMRSGGTDISLMRSSHAFEADEAGVHTPVDCLTDVDSRDLAGEHAPPSHLVLPGSQSPAFSIAVERRAAAGRVDGRRIRRWLAATAEGQPVIGALLPRVPVFEGHSCHVRFPSPVALAPVTLSRSAVTCPGTAVNPAGVRAASRPSGRGPGGSPRSPRERPPGLWRSCPSEICRRFRSCSRQLPQTRLFMSLPQALWHQSGPDRPDDVREPQAPAVQRVAGRGVPRR